MRTRLTGSQFFMVLVVLILGSLARAEVFVEDVPSPIGAHEARKIQRGGGTIYKCEKMKVSKKTGNLKKVKKSKAVFTAASLKSISNADDKFDANEKLYVCNSMVVDEETNKLVKEGDDD